MHIAGRQLRRPAPRWRGGERGLDAARGVGEAAPGPNALASAALARKHPPALGARDVAIAFSNDPGNGEVGQAGVATNAVGQYKLQGAAGVGVDPVQLGNGGATPCDGSGGGPPRTGSGQCTACKAGFTGAGGVGNCDQCVAGNYGQQCLTCSAPCVAPGGTCNDGRGGDGTCICATGWDNAPIGCTDCAVNFFGPSCTPCALCNAPGGLCSGSGTHTGDGTCVCQGNWANPANGCEDCAANAWGNACSLCTCDPLGGTCNGAGTHGGDGTCGGVCNAGCVIAERSRSLRLLDTH